MKRDLDLKIFENADEKTTEELSESFRAVGKKESERIYRICRRKYEGDLSATSDETERGVEAYARPKWRAVAGGAAACVALGVGAAGTVYALRNFNSPQESLTAATNSEFSDTGEAISWAETWAYTENATPAPPDDTEDASRVETSEEATEQIVITYENVTSEDEPAADFTEAPPTENASADHQKTTDASQKYIGEEIDKQDPTEETTYATVAPNYAEIISILSRLSYSDETCDGIPEYEIEDRENGIWYLINLSGANKWNGNGFTEMKDGGWVWKHYKDANGNWRVEEAVFDKPVGDAIRAYMEQYGLAEYCRLYG